MVETPLTIVPAPTRRWAARRRGGDPVARVAMKAVAGHPEIAVVRGLRMRAFAQDSVGLTTSARERNVAGRVLLSGAAPCTEVVVVDDIVTTGATARESVRVLQAAGTRVAAVLAIAVA
jgi:predicted amidophosphoribosyltransferase